MEDAGKVRVVVEMGGLEEVRLLQAERRGQAAQEGPERLEILSRSGRVQEGKKGHPKVAHHQKFFFLKMCQISSLT